MTTPLGPPSPTPNGSARRLRYLMIGVALLVVGGGTALGLNFTLESPTTTVATSESPSTSLPETTTTFPESTTTLPVTTTPVETPPPAPTSEVAVVEEYFAALDVRDFQRAWDLGGKNIGGNFSQWAEGYSTTLSHDLTSVSSEGDMVHVTFVATQTTGEQRTYQGTYTVRNGVIVSATATRILAYSPYS